jgi:hypothetical protein
LANFGGDDLIVYGGDDLASFGGDDNLITLGGDDLANFGGDDLASFGGDDLIVLAGDVQPEPTYTGAKGIGRDAPSEITACIAGTVGCFEDTQPFTPQFHRVALSWSAPAVGHGFYQLQRRRADVPNSNWVDAGTTTTNHFIDPAVLPNGLLVTYRIRMNFDDPPAVSGWAYLRIPTDFIAARNDLPDPRADSYVTPKNGPNSFTVPAPGVLGVSCTSNTQCNQGFAGTDADRSSDSPSGNPPTPPAYVARRAVLVSGPVIQGTNTPFGTLAFNPNGGFTLSGWPSGLNQNVAVTFQYKANDGFWSVDPTVPMNGKDGQGNERFSPPVTVTIVVQKK